MKLMLIIIRVIVLIFRKRRVGQACKTLSGLFNQLSVKLGFCSPNMCFTVISELLHVTLSMSVMELLK